MKTRHFDHIDLRVKDVERAMKFYSKLLPALGFTRDQSGKVWKVFESESKQPASEFFGFTEATDHVPNAVRIAFWADSRAEVDRVGKIAREAGAKNIEGPELCTEYDPNYYAVFFEDPDGNKLEVCCRLAE